MVWPGLPAWPEAQAKTRGLLTWPQAQQAAEAAPNQQAVREGQPEAALASCLPAWPVAHRMTAMALTPMALQGLSWPCWLLQAPWRSLMQSQRAKG